VSGAEIAAILARLTGVRDFRYHAVPGIVMRLFAPEFWKMRRAFEKHGRPPYPPEIDRWVAETRALCAEPTTMERFLTEKFGPR